VADLIAQLQELPQHLEVWADGCDCTNPTSGVAQVPSSRVIFDHKAKEVVVIRVAS
jgi:hypothetical protein